MSTSLARQHAAHQLQRWQVHLGRVRRRQSRLGFTLIELLVVIAILLLLLAVAIPALAPPIEERAMREASRGINAFLAGARDRAISTGRPYGVQLVRFDPRATTTDQLGAASTVAQDLRAANSCFTLRYVQVPPPYAGDFESSRMVVSNPGGVSTITHAGQVQTNGSAGAPDVPTALVRRGDLVQFAGVGHLYEIMGGSVDSNGYLTGAEPLKNCTLRSDTNPYPFATVQLGTVGAGLPYQILRAPVRAPGAAHPIPESVVLDFTSSGIADNEFYSSAVNQNPVTIMFAPSGGIDRVYCGATGNVTLTQGFRPNGAIYLMLGRPNQMSLTPTPAVQNWQDLKNLWLSVNVRTGLIQSNETYCPIGQARPASRFESRFYARERQGMGGR